MRTQALTAAILLVTLAGCTSAPNERARDAATGMPVALIKADDARAATVVYTGSGERADWGTVEGAARNADVVVIAEQHGHPVGLSAAAALWRSMIADAGKAGDGYSPALALEFFERDDQTRLDDYLATPALSTEDIFLKRTGKTAAAGANPWESSYPPGHRDMVEAAKEKHLRVYAANAPRAYVRLARTNGYAALSTLTPEQRRLVVLPRFASDEAPPENRYWRDFLKFMSKTPEQYAGSSPTDREKVDGMFRSQSIWDATMADTVRLAIAEGHTPVVLVVGQFHADYSALGGGGTVQALRSVRPDTRIVTVSFQSSDDKRSWKPDDKDRADFVVYTGKNQAAKDEETPSPTPTQTPSTSPHSPHAPAATTSPVRPAN